MAEPVVIIGAGGHGKVVLDILRAEGRYDPVGFLDTKAKDKWGGLPILGPSDWSGFQAVRRKGVARVIVAIGSNLTRMGYLMTVEQAGVELVNAIHPTAFISPTATLGKGVVIAPKASVITEARIGDGAIVNTGAVVDHECVVGEGCHVAPGAVLAGRVKLGRGAFVGINAAVRQCVTVGEFATIGAGAVVIRDVPPGVTVVGVPACRVLPTR